MTDEVELQDTSIPETESESPDAVASEGNDDALEEESSTSVEEEEEPKERKKPWFTARIDDLTANWRSTERERDYWKEQALKGIEKPPEAAEKPPVQSTEKPLLENFESYEDFSEAVAEWKFEQKMAEREQQTRAQTEAEQRAEAARTFQQRSESVRTLHSDFDAVLSSLPYSEMVDQATMASEKGPELLYYLGTNPEAANRLFSLPPVAQAMELGRIEASLSRPPPKQSSAPDPISPIGGSGGSQTVNPEKMTMAEYAKWSYEQRSKQHQR